MGISNDSSKLNTCNAVTFVVTVESTVDVTAEGTGCSEYDFISSLNLYFTEKPTIKKVFNHAIVDILTF